MRIVRAFIFILVVLLAGCYTPYTNIKDLLPENQARAEYNCTIDGILHYYFTEEAYSVIKDIPTVNGVSFGPYAAGTTFLSEVASILMGTGYGRKVIMTDESFRNWGIGGIIHEYVHHLDDIGRDGGTRWVDIAEFIQQYNKCVLDFKYRGLGDYIDFYANRWFTNTFGIGPHSEYIAYVSDYFYNKKTPEYLRYVYRKILRLDRIQIYD